MPETQKQPMAVPPSRSPEAGALFQVLTRRKSDPEQVYTAIREIESMSGQSVVAQLTALIQTTAAQQTTQLHTAIAELSGRVGDVEARVETANGRLDSVEKQLGRIWTFLFLILGTLLGTLTTLLTTLLLRG